MAKLSPFRRYPNIAQRRTARNSPVALTTSLQIRPEYLQEARRDRSTVASISGLLALSRNRSAMAMRVLPRSIHRQIEYLNRNSMSTLAMELL